MPNGVEKPGIDPRLALLVGTLGIACSSILIRLSTAPSLVTATWRLCLTMLLLAPVVLWRNRAELARLRLRDVALCCLSGFLLAFHFLCWFESLRHTSVAIAAVLVSTDAIFTAIGYTLFMKGRLPRLGPLAIGLTFAGSAIIALGQGSGGAAGLLGGALALAGAVLFSAYTLLGRRQRGHLSTGVYTFICYGACCATLLLLCLLTGTPLLGWGGRNILLALGLAVLSTLLGHSMLSWCLRYLSPAYVATAKLGEPVLSAIMAAILFSEVPTPVQLAGAVIVLAGILLYTRAEAKAK